jgi:hypothetical protein
MTMKLPRELRLSPEPATNILVTEVTERGYGTEFIGIVKTETGEHTIRALITAVLK